MTKYIEDNFKEILFFNITYRDKHLSFNNVFQEESIDIVKDGIINMIENKERKLLEKELLEIQKKEIIENKSYKENQEKFTFVLALGVLITLLISIKEIILELSNNNMFIDMMISVVIIAILFSVFLKIKKDLECVIHRHMSLYKFYQIHLTKSLKTSLGVLLSKLKCGLI